MATVELLQNSFLAHEISLGRTVSPLIAENRLGEKISIEYAEKPTVLYVFSPDCVWCHRNLRNIAAVHEKQQNNFRFIGLSVLRSNSPSSTDSGEPPFDTYFNPSDLSRLEYGFRSTPATYIISPEGKITNLWLGAYNEKVVKDIEEFFDLELPGLAD